MDFISLIFLILSVLIFSYLVSKFVSLFIRNIDDKFSGKYSKQLKLYIYDYYDFKMPKNINLNDLLFSVKNDLTKQENNINNDDLISLVCEIENLISSTKKETK